jgi:DNA-binding GntR family transcriptional regulator
MVDDRIRGMSAVNSSHSEGASVALLSEARRTYADLACGLLRSMILSGDIGAGERLNEVALAGRFDISRGPLREAIQRLVSEGMLVVRPHRGTYVRTFAPRELADLYSLRAALETWALREAARDRADELVEVLTRNLRLSDEKLAAGLPVYDEDVDFHRAIVQLAANPALTDAHASVMQRLELARTRSAFLPARARDSHREHDDVLRALIDSRPDDARAALELHLTRAERSALDVIERAGARRTTL